MVKNIKNLLLLNQKADDLETWYAALVTVLLPNCSNDDWVDLDLFYSKVPFVFILENALAVDFQETVEACEVNIGVHIVK